MAGKERNFDLNKGASQVNTQKNILLKVTNTTLKTIQCPKEEN